VTGIIGPNGAGKSTFLNIIAGALRCNCGKVFFEENDIASLPSHKIGQLGIVRTFQKASIFPSLTTIENMLIGAVPTKGSSLLAGLAGTRFWNAYERDPLSKAWSLIDKFGLQDVANQTAGTLSGGQRRLVELARAILMDPVVLLLDEPMAGVSPSLIPKLLEHLEEVVSSGVTIVMIEHDLAVIESTCNVVVFMANGRVIAQGDIKSVLSNETVLASAQGY
jgi:branched-chain amino acid transport system ATP-binding protein